MEFSIPFKDASNLHKQTTSSSDYITFDFGADTSYYETADGKILESKYESITPDEVGKQQHHLSDEQRKKLVEALSTVKRLFSGKLGKFTKHIVSLKLKPNAHPIHCKPYPVPKIHEPVFKAELKRLQEVDVLDHIQVLASAHAYPSFIIPKKDGRVRWISDFRLLNQMLIREIFPLPVIHDVLRRQSKYQFFTKIDISMCYYTFQLDEASSNLCIIITPFGKY
ncbi:MAG: hypothetical protein AAFQ92_29505, partial [Bacteroidota bacterium]